MQDITLESLARRVEALERAVGVDKTAACRKDWRRVVGMFGDSEFMRQVDAEGQAIREAERDQARHPDSTCAEPLE